MVVKQGLNLGVSTVPDPMDARNEAVNFQVLSAWYLAERGVLPCGGGLPALYGGLSFPVRGFGVPCTGQQGMLRGEKIRLGFIAFGRSVWYNVRMKTTSKMRMR